LFQDALSVREALVRLLESQSRSEAFGTWVATILVSETSKRQVLGEIEKPDGFFMNEFLLLALIIIYLAISYVPISGAPKPTWQGQPSEQSSHGNAETNDEARS
jgi:hypothetical protein